MLLNIQVWFSLLEILLTCGGVSTLICSLVGADSWLKATVQSGGKHPVAE